MTSLQTLPSLQESIELCRASIRGGSKSFWMASLFFNSEIKEDVFCLYGWCRYCDDQIDGAETKVNALIALRVLQEKTKSCFERQLQTDPIFIAFSYLVQKYSIPKEYPIELLEGMRMDVEGYEYKNEDDLRLYAYRVAGTVGLMMTHIIGVSSDRALDYAVALGIGMQYTNIARDVREDAEMGRVYLPATWLHEYEIQKNDLLSNDWSLELKEKVYKVVLKLIKHSEIHYKKSRKGIPFLPFRSGLTIKIASLIYSEIGMKIKRKKESYFESRTVTSSTDKVLLVLRVLITSFPQFILSFLKPFQRSKIDEVWRIS